MACVRLGASGASLPGALAGAFFLPDPGRLPPCALAFLETSRAASAALRFPICDLVGSGYDS